jgi:nitrite reductase/ring-hydroxylating ferredoxin subunit
MTKPARNETTMTQVEREEDCAACGGCDAGRTRREFVRDAVTAAVAALATVCGSQPLEAATFGWARLLRSSDAKRVYAIPAEDGVQIDRASEVILVRWQGSMYAFALSCPHQRSALRWEEDRARFQCPKHHSRYTPDGAFVSGRATRGMDRYAVTRDGSGVSVDTGTLHKQSDDPAAWRAATIRV